MAWPVDAAGFREAARRRLPHMLFEYLDGGSYKEATLRRNEADYGRLALRQRVLRDGSSLRTTTTLFGREQAAPIVLAPVGLSGMYARRGEAQAARAACAHGIPLCLSTVSICGIEEVTEAAGRAPWFQLYMIRDRGYMHVLLDRARAAGADILVFTVDLPTPGARYREARSGMLDRGTRALIRQAAQAALRPSWLWDVHIRGRPHSFGHLEEAMPLGQGGIAKSWQWLRANFDPSVTWADIQWVRENWKGKLVIKGILDADDALLAVEHGADGIVVSNHGGRQLDSVRSTVSALPAIVENIDGSIPVLVDGGIRSGLDILKAMALGANAVMLGRAWAYALAAGGERGVHAMLDILLNELRAAMILTGCSDLRDASAELLDRDIDNHDGRNLLSELALLIGPA